MNCGIKLNKKVFTALLVTGTLAFSSVVSAQDGEEKLADKIFDGWSGTATLGATTSSGNTDTSNINGSIRLGKRVDRWEHLVFGSIFKGTSSLVITDRDETGAVITGDDGRPQRTIIKGDNSDRIALGYQPKFYFREQTYAFGILDYEQDEPANIDSVFRQIFGIGHRFFSSDSGFLSGEIGFGNKNTDLVFGDDISGGIGYLGLNFLSQVTDEVTFNADLRSDFGSDNTFVEIGLGVAFKVSDNLALSITHFTRSNSNLADEDDLAGSSDSVTSMNLVIDI